MVDDSSEAPAAKQQVLETGEIRWDLRKPPTREELGLPSGEDTLIYEYDDDRTIRAELVLPGQTLSVDARYVAVSDILSGPPSIDLQFWAQSFEPAKAQLQRAVEQFGLPSSAVQQWQREVARAERSDSQARVKTPWLDARLGGATVAVQGRYSPEEETAAVSYQVSWAAGSDDG